MFQEKLQEVLNKLSLSKDKLEQLMAAMLNDFKNGLSDNPECNHQSPIKMLVTYVRSVPNGTEEGDYFALDLGGTNFRVLLCKIHNRKVEMSNKVYPIDDSLMKGTAEMLFGYIAQSLAHFAHENGVTSGQICHVGFTFSFPVHQRSLTSGVLIKWTKGYSAVGVEGEDVVKLLHEAIEKRSVSLLLYLLN